MKEATPFNSVTLEEIAADVAREYLEIDHLNGTETFERTRNAIKAALLAAYEKGAEKNPLLLSGKPQDKAACWKSR
jgi:hypothetical protein